MRDECVRTVSAVAHSTFARYGLTEFFFFMNDGDAVLHAPWAP